MAFGREDLSSTAPLGGDIAFFDNGLGDDELDEAGRNGLHRAVMTGRLEIVQRVLLAHREFINTVTKIGESCLHLAVLYAPRRVLTELIGAGCDIRLRKKNGFTALHEASWTGRDSAVEVLLKCGADPLDPTPTGETSVDLARRFHRVGVAMLLTARLRELGSLRKEALVEHREHEWKALLATKAAGFKPGSILNADLLEGPATATQGAEGAEKTASSAEDRWDSEARPRPPTSPVARAWKDPAEWRRLVASLGGDGGGLEDAGAGAADEEGFDGEEEEDDDADDHEAGETGVDVASARVASVQSGLGGRRARP